MRNRAITNPLMRGVSLDKGIRVKVVPLNDTYNERNNNVNQTFTGSRRRNDFERKNSNTRIERSRTGSRRQFNYENNYQEINMERSKSRNNSRPVINQPVQSKPVNYGVHYTNILNNKVGLYETNQLTNSRGKNTFFENHNIYQLEKQPNPTFNNYLSTKRPESSNYQKNSVIGESNFSSFNIEEKFGRNLNLVVNEDFTTNNFQQNIYANPNYDTRINHPKEMSNFTNENFIDRDQRIPVAPKLQLHSQQEKANRQSTPKRNQHVTAPRKNNFSSNNNEVSYNTNDANFTSYKREEKVNHVGINLRNIVKPPETTKHVSLGYPINLSDETLNYKKLAKAYIPKNKVSNYVSTKHQTNQPNPRNDTEYDQEVQQKKIAREAQKIAYGISDNELSREFEITMLENEKYKAVLKEKEQTQKHNTETGQFYKQRNKTFLDPDESETMIAPECRQLIVDYFNEIYDLNKKIKKLEKEHSKWSNSFESAEADLFDIQDNHELISDVIRAECREIQKHNIDVFQKDVNYRLNISNKRELEKKLIDNEVTMHAENDRIHKENITVDNEIIRISNLINQNNIAYN